MLIKLIGGVVRVGAACSGNRGTVAHHEAGAERVVDQINGGVKRLERVLVGR